MQNPIQYGTIPAIINAVGNLIWSLAIPAGIIMIIYAGWLYIFGGACPQSVQKAHSAITWAILGIILVIIGSGIAKTICGILGVKSSVC